MNIEFLNRYDGLKGMIEHYGLNFENTQGIEGSNRYVALVNNETDLTNAYTTDGLLKKFNLVSLEDDKNFFLPY